MVILDAIKMSTAQTNEFLLGQEGSSRKQIQNITEMIFPSKYLGKL